MHVFIHQGIVFIIYPPQYFFFHIQVLDFYPGITTEHFGITIFFFRIILLCTYMSPFFTLYILITFESNYSRTLRVIYIYVVFALVSPLLRAQCSTNLTMHHSICVTISHIQSLLPFTTLSLTTASYYNLILSLHSP